VNGQANIINGKLYAEKILANLEQEITLLKEQNKRIPTLAIILVGEDPASHIYVRNKLRAASRIGMNAFQVNLPVEIPNNQLLEEINKLNYNSDISGIIVQLPLPNHIDQANILLAIKPEKDVDGFHPLNVGYLHSSSLKNQNEKQGFVPCTALGCLYLIKQVEPNLSGKNVVIIGRSNIVGKPLSALLLREDCTITICHSKTQNLNLISSKADIVISAIGNPLKLTADYFNKNSIVIDVGITKLPHSNKIVGDVDFENVVGKVKHITPVPGGVGPMTVAFLLHNTFKSCI